MAGNYPTAVKFVDSRLLIAWDDGHQSVYAPTALRFACGCAECVSELTGARLLRREDIPADIKPQEMRPVGRYGFAIHWSDGHSTGIYTFERLRALCQCEACLRK